MTKIITIIKKVRYFLLIFGILQLFNLFWIGIIFIGIFFLSFIIQNENSIMSKQKAIKIISEKFDLKLNDNNTYWSENSGDTWSLNIFNDTQQIISYIILNNNKTNKLHLFELKANDEIYEKLFCSGNSCSLAFFLNDSKFIENHSLTFFNNFHIGSIKY